MKSAKINGVISVKSDGELVTGKIDGGFPFYQSAPLEQAVFSIWMLPKRVFSS
jgi:hypothetical protein